MRRPSVLQARRDDVDARVLNALLKHPETLYLLHERAGVGRWATRRSLRRLRAAGVAPAAGATQRGAAGGPR